MLAVHGFIQHVSVTASERRATSCSRCCASITLPKSEGEAVIGPKLDPNSWGEPLRWHNFFGHSFRFRRSVLASPSRRRGLGKGTAFESPSPAVL
jgi:hypothetical protein